MALAVARERGSPGRILLATAPLALWHAFALVYYGALLPNTAAAKLGAGIGAAVLAARSAWAFEWVARIDPLTLPAIAAGLGAGLWLAVRERRAMPAALALGIVLHLLWIVRIGGDFMGGRFFVAPLWVAALLLAAWKYAKLRHPATWLAVGVNLFILGLEPIGRSPAMQRLLVAMIRG